jgi:glycerol dehydrogenase-like iron-containing ADH family enzyme
MKPLNDRAMLPILAIAPARVLRGHGIIANLDQYLNQARLTSDLNSPCFWITGEQSRQILSKDTTPNKLPTKLPTKLHWHWSDPIAECSEANLESLQQQAKSHSAQVIIGAGGGKVLDAAKLVAEKIGLPIVTIPTSAATCAAWTALSNVYSDAGAFAYDLTLRSCPEMILVDYRLIASAPKRTLIAGIGDAIAKWYEASVSSGASDRTMVIGAVQQARVLRDILFQKSVLALEEIGGSAWQEVVDATVCMAGVIGGMGGAECRTVAAHAIHNGLTHLTESHSILHGEKVAYGILVQLRLEEFQGNQLAATARNQLLKFYAEIGLPKSLSDLGLSDLSLKQLLRVAAIACAPNSDIHRLPFAVSEEQVLAAMVSTTLSTGVAAASLSQQII